MSLFVSFLWVILGTIVANNPIVESGDSDWIVESPAQSRAFAFYGSDSMWLLTLRGELLLTDDGGQTWERIANDLTRDFQQLTFIDAYRGWAIDKRHKIMRTIDRGRSWFHLSSLGDGGNAFMLPIKLQFIDSYNGWAGTPTAIWATTNGGNTWSRFTPSLGEPSIERIVGFHFSDVAQGWLGTDRGRVYRTRDSGKWNLEKSLSDAGFPVANIGFFGSSVGWITFQTGTSFYHTRNGGRDWRRKSLMVLDDPATISSLLFVSDQEGWIVGNTIDPRSKHIKKSVLLYSSNAGDHWREMHVADGEPRVSYAQFSDPLRGWVLGRERVYRTDDRGETWRNVLTVPAKPR